VDSKDLHRQNQSTSTFNIAESTLVESICTTLGHVCPTRARYRYGDRSQPGLLRPRDQTKAKLFVFSDFSFALAFRKVLFVFCILSPPRVAQSRLPKSHVKVRFARQLKSTSVFKSHLKVRSALHKVDFSFQVSSHSTLRAATKVDFGF
jgi:hypothetical protein